MQQAQQVTCKSPTHHSCNTSAQLKCYRSPFEDNMLHHHPIPLSTHLSMSPRRRAMRSRIMRYISPLQAAGCSTSEGEGAGLWMPVN